MIYSDFKTTIIAFLKVFFRSKKTPEEEKALNKLFSYILDNKNNSGWVINTNKNKEMEEMYNYFLFLIFQAYDSAPEIEKDKRLLGIEEILRAFRKRFNIKKQATKKILSDIKAEKPIFKYIPDNHYSDIIDNLINNLFNNFSQKQENKTTNNFTSNQTELNQTKSDKSKNPLTRLKNFLTDLTNKEGNSPIKVIAYLLLAVGSVAKIPVDICGWMGKGIIKLMSDGKSSGTPNAERTADLEQGIDDLGHEADNIKKDGKDQEKNEKDDIGTTDIIAEQSSTTGILFPTESLSTAVSSKTSDNDNLIEDNKDTADGENRNHEGYKEEDSNTLGGEEESPDIMGRNKIEEAEEDSELKRDEIISKTDNPTIIPENDVLSAQQTYGVEEEEADNEILNGQLDNDDDVSPKLDIFEETITASTEDRRDTEEPKESLNDPVETAEDTVKSREKQSQPLQSAEKEETNEIGDRQEPISADAKQEEDMEKVIKELGKNRESPTITH